MGKNKVEFLVIDLFCGAGGTTTGFVKVSGGAFKVIACVNHDPVAIKSHWLNHKKVKHFEEDIRTLDLTELIQLTNHFRKLYPHAKVILWASLECTNFSKAKGGLPREADSRTLADHLDRYILALNPDYVQIENVVEFMSWGPLDENGKPISRRAGSDWMKWRERLCSYGYKDSWKEMNAADYGAYTSRNRLFGIFAKHGLPIAWPNATHAKKPEKAGTMYGKQLKKWKAVRHVLELEVKGQSIFTRKKPLSPKTMQRIHAGLVKFVAGGKEAFLVKYNSMGANGNYAAPDLEKPLDTIPIRNMHYLAHPEFILQMNGGNPESKSVSIDRPARTILATGGKQYLVHSQFLSAYYSNGNNVSGIEEPAPTITTKDRIAIVDPQFIMRDFQTTSNTSIEEPARTLLPVPKQHLVTAEPFIINQNYDNGPKSIDEPASTITANRKWHYLINPSWFNQSPSSIEDPCFTIIARMDKAPPYLVTTESGHTAIEVYDTDCEYTVKIKFFMAMYGIMDIKMRMLLIRELIRIQGFPKHYKLTGTQGDQKKFIGNSVVPHAVTSWAVALKNKLNETELNHIAA